MLPLLLLALADPPVAVVVRPPELPPSVRARLLVLLAEPQPTSDAQVHVRRDGVLDQAAAPLHRQELIALDRWLTVRPRDVSQRQRAIRLAEALGDKPAEERHTAALGRTLWAATAHHPRSADARVRYADWLRTANRDAVAAGVAAQATRLAPESADAWWCRALAADDWVAALTMMETAAGLAPADWRVPAARCDLRARRLLMPTRSPAEREGDTADCELDRQTAVRLGGGDPACVRWSAAVAMTQAVVSWSKADAAGVGRRLRDRGLPAVAQLAELTPADPRLVLMAVAFELMTRELTGELSAGDRPLWDRLPDDARLRFDRWLAGAAATVATADGPEACEMASAGCRLFVMTRQYDRAVAAGERAVTLRPGEPYCEEAIQKALLYAGRATDAAARCRANPAGRSPAAAAAFEAVCLQRAGRWAEARQVAEAAAPRSADPDLTLALAACRLHADTPADRAVADAMLAELSRELAGRPAGDLTRRRAARLTVVAHLLSGRFTEADGLLDRCRRDNQILSNDKELTAAARPYLWPQPTAPAAEAIVVPVSAREPQRGPGS